MSKGRAPPFRFGIGDAVQRRAGRSGHLDPHAVVHFERIVTRRYRFVVVAVIGRTASADVLLPAAFGAQLARVGHDLHVAHVGAARAAQVGVGEADDDAVRVVIPRTPVPALVDVLRAGLNGAERNGGAHEDMAVAARTDIGIDICGRSGDRGGGNGCAAGS